MKYFAGVLVAAMSSVLPICSNAFEVTNTMCIQKVTDGQTLDEIKNPFIHQMEFKSQLCNSGKLSLSVYGNNNYQRVMHSFNSKKPMRITYICATNACESCILVEIDKLQ